MNPSQAGMHPAPGGTPAQRHDLDRAAAMSASMRPTVQLQDHQKTLPSAEASTARAVGVGHSQEPSLTAIENLQARLNTHVEEVKRMIGLAKDVTAQPGGRKQNSQDSASPPPPVPHPSRSAVAHPFSRSANPAKQLYHSSQVPPAPSDPDYSQTGFEESTNSIADCHPWSGSHNEDKLNEFVIKSGYTEKQKVINEANQAKPTIWPQLKQGTGLQALSAIFTATLTQKKEFGRITSQSTFKPPPRVTLTDSKREAWLRDLADDSVPLRRLSRTIPHGIRGKSLLDQCLAKTIPCPRAVWLVKCVGANELRAFRRKGISAATAAGNESKWIKEWTSLVEAFIEGTVDPNGDQVNQVNRAKFGYAIHLTMQLYTEKLLDVAHFLDWVLAFFERCQLQQLPIATLFVQTYWRDIAASFTTAQRASNICCMRLANFPKDAHNDQKQSILLRVRKVFRSCMDQNARSCIFTTSWKPVRALLQTLSQGHSPCNKVLIEGIIERNDKLDKIIRSDATSQCKRILSVVKILDTFDGSQPVQTIASQCVSHLGSILSVIQTLIRYACCASRTGPSRVNLAAACIQHLAVNIPEVSSLLTDCVASTRYCTYILPRNLCMVMNHLIAKRVFDPAMYLRWCMTSGVMNGVESTGLDAIPCARLIRDMHYMSLSSNVASLRRLLLSPLYDLDEEQRSMSELQALCRQALPTCFGSSAFNIDADFGHKSFNNLATFLDKCNDAVTQAFCAWTYQRVINWATTKKSSLRTNSAQDLWPCEDFFTLRYIVEKGSNTHLLAQCLRALLDFSDLDLLSCIADTIYAHRKSLKIDSTCNSLLAMCIERYRMLRQSAPPSRDALYSLSRLVAQEPQLAQLKHHLEQERDICNQTLGAVAYTPASESMTDSQDIAGSIDAEVERLLSSGTGIDMNAVQQVFKLLQAHGQNDLKHAVTFVSSNGQLFARLRDANVVGFDELLGKWLNGLLIQCDAADLKALAVSLVGTGCMDLVQMMSRFKHILDTKETGANTILGMVHRISALLDTSREHSWAEFQNRELYRYTADVSVFIDGHACSLSRFLLSTLSKVDAHTHGPSVTTFLVKILKVANVKDAALLKGLLIEHKQQCTNVVSQLLEESIAIDKAQYDAMIATKVVSHPEALSDDNELFKKIFQAAEPVNLESCALALSFVYDGQDYQNEAIERAAGDCLSNEGLCWPQLLVATDQAVASRICEQAADELLSIKPDLQAFTFSDDQVITKVKNCLNVVSSLSTTIAGSSSSTVCLKLAQSFAIIARRIALQRQEGGKQLLDHSIQEWIDCLLQFTLLHRAMLKAAANVAELQRCLSFLAIIALAGAGLIATSVRKFAFDVCAYFVADLPVSTLASVRQQIGDPPPGSLANFLFGPRAHDSAWLQLITPPNKPTTAASSAYSTPQPTQPPPQATAYPLRPFELLPESTPNAGANDTALSLRLFGARQISSRPL